MPDVSFVFTNPRHHVEMMVPVALELNRRGISTQLVSLAELRGFQSPAVNGVAMRRVIPLQLRRRTRLAHNTPNASAGQSRLRVLAQRATSLALVPLVRWHVRASRVVVIPNDSVFPYVQLVAAQRKRSRFVLLQEGIRFESPDRDRYGTGGTDALCAWGEGSAELFRARGAPAETVHVTGAPRLDSLDPRAWRVPGEELRAKLGLAKSPVAFLSNPIENQGYCTADAKLDMFAAFLDEAEPWFRREQRVLLVKNHLHEDPARFSEVAARSRMRDLVHVLPDVPLFAAIAASAGAIVLTSTVGLESLMFGVPIAALEIPRHGFGFEYVSRDAAVALRPGAVSAGLTELVAPTPARRAAGDALVARHVHDRGGATGRVADVVTRLL